MKKLAIFVEGQTELIFTDKLLKEIAGANNIVIEQQRASKTKRGQRSFVTISETYATSDISGQQYYVLIRDCCSGSSVKSDILKTYKSLLKIGYEQILGLQDVYPKTHRDIPKLILGLRYGIPTRDIPISMMLAVMEIEAWFIAETSHFLRISSSLTNDRINSQLGFDPCTLDVESIPHPAKDLHAIYKLAGLSYKKDRRRVQRTVNTLDYAALYLDKSNTVQSLGEFIGKITSFLS